VTTKKIKMNKVKTPLSKTNLLLGIGGSVLFVVTGLWLFTTMADQQTTFNPYLVKGVGAACVLFFGAAGVYGVKKLLERKQVDN